MSPVSHRPDPIATPVDFKLTHYLAVLSVPQRHNEAYIEGMTTRRSKCSRGLKFPRVVAGLCMLVIFAGTSSGENKVLGEIQLVWKLLLVVMIAKFAALVISLGSGTSGGLLAPTFMWSAAMGGLFAMVGNHVFPAAHLSPGAFALVAMGAVFGAASGATFSFIIFAFEITRDYNSVLPLMLVAVIADGIAML